MEKHCRTDNQYEKSYIVGAVPEIFSGSDGEISFFDFNAMFTAFSEFAAPSSSDGNPKRSEKFSQPCREEWGELQQFFQVPVATRIWHT